VDSSPLIRSVEMNGQEMKIRKAYDLTIEQHEKGIDPLKSVPEDIKSLPGYAEIIKDPSLGSGAVDIREYLKLETGMRFLDAGCCANLANYRLDKWPCAYYGVDISAAMVRAMKTFTRKNGISIGGLYNTGLGNMPFRDNFFHVAAMIGVLEYYSLEYMERVLIELRRVLRRDAKMVLDMPNPDHPHVETMFRLEEYLQRPHIPKQREELENLLEPMFRIEHVDDSRVMLKYFVRGWK
jgi:SAM-dependent methyltransferase